MAQPFNPYEHHHDHGVDGDHEGHDHGLPAAELDPAQQSLSDALRVSFLILKVVMALLVVAYLFSGIFSVPAQEVAVRLRFGRIVGAGTREQVIPPGGPHFAWPYPIEQVVLVPIQRQQLTLNNEFWYEIAADPAGRKDDEALGRPGPIDPEKSGSLLTGDANIIHARLTVSYQLKRQADQIDPAAVLDYVQHVGAAATADRLVRAAAEQGIVYAFAQLKADDVARKQLNNAVAVRRAQAVLDQMHTGLTLYTDQGGVLAAAATQPAPAPGAPRAEESGIALVRAVFPSSVRDAVQSVINAENEKAQALEKARQEYTTALNQAAGEGAETLLALIDEYEVASAAGDAQRVAALDAGLDAAFNDLALTTTSGRKAISGDVATMLNEARSYRTQIENQLRAEAQTFEKLRAGYQANPAIFVQNFWQKAVQDILSGNRIEVFYLPPGQVYLDLSRDAKLRKAWEEEDIKAQDKAGSK